MLTVVPAAVSAFQRALNERGTPQASIRVGVQGGGCSGYAYILDFEDDPPRPTDTVLDLGVRVLVDPKSRPYLEGAELTYEAGLAGRGFRFVNPNVLAACGCGRSVCF